MNKRIIVCICIPAVLALGALGWREARQSPAASGNSAAENLAVCLNKSGAVFYGASWCSHCQNQKAKFGSAAGALPYVDCPTSPQECLKFGVTAYPTWVLPDGQRLIGEQSLANLAKASRCKFQ